MTSVTPSGGAMLRETFSIQTYRASDCSPTDQSAVQYVTHAVLRTARDGYVVRLQRRHGEALGTTKVPARARPVRSHESRSTHGTTIRTSRPDGRSPCVGAHSVSVWRFG